MAGGLARGVAMRRLDTYGAESRTLGATRALSPCQPLQAGGPARCRQLDEGDRLDVTRPVLGLRTTLLLLSYLGWCDGTCAGRPNLDRRRRADDVAEASVLELIAELGNVAESGICEHDVLSHPTSDGRVELIQRGLPLRLEGHVLGNPDAVSTRFVLAPLLGKVEAHVDAATAALTTKVKADAHLAVVDAPESAGILALHADGVDALFGKAGVVENERLDTRKFR